MTKTTIGLKDFEVYAYHGYYPEEREKGNNFIINIQVYLSALPSEEDELTDTLNYEELYQICNTEMQNTSKLLETVAVRIVKQIQHRFSVMGGIIKIEKLNPPMDAKIHSSFVELEF